MAAFRLVIPDPFKPDIAEMLDDDAEAPATVILQTRGYEGRITILLLNRQWVGNTLRRAGT